MNKLSEINYYNFEINFNTNNSFYNIGTICKIVDTTDGESFVFRELN